MIKLVVCDMDGTLLNQYDELHSETFDIIKKLKEKGIMFAAASGRQYYNLLNKFSGVKDDIIFAAENGSYVACQDKELYSSSLDCDILRDLIQHGRKLTGCELILCGKKGAYIEKSYPEFIKEVEKYYLRYEIVNSFEDIEDDILKFTICDFTGTEKNSYPIIYPIFKDKVQIAVSGLIWLDVNNKGVNKGVAVRLLQDKFNITAEETMTFGDYYNDIEMFKASWHSYAMENAPDEVKKHARFTANSHRENGVLEMIKDKLL